MKQQTHTRITGDKGMEPELEITVEKLVKKYLPKVELLYAYCFSEAIVCDSECKHLLPACKTLFTRTEQRHIEYFNHYCENEIDKFMTKK